MQITQSSSFDSKLTESGNVSAYSEDVNGKMRDADIPTQVPTASLSNSACANLSDPNSSTQLGKILPKTDFKSVNVESAKTLGYSALFSEVDSEGFVKAFDVSNLEAIEWSEIEGFYHKHGFVVVRGAYSEQEVADSIDEFWALKNAESEAAGTGSIDQNDPSTWRDYSWMAGQEGRGDNRGFVETGMDSLSLPAFWNNYQNPAIVSLYQKFFNNDDILMTEGRYGCMRPTKGIPVNGGTMDKPEWRTQASWLHWDQNPWDQPGFHGLQGLLALSDQTLTSGGFVCVPGFNKEMDDWAEGRPRETVDGNRRAIVIVPEDCQEIHDRTVPITMKKGDFILWDSRLPHCNFPNQGAEYRLVQYIMYAPLDAQDKKQQVDLLQMKMLNSADNQMEKVLTPLGRKITGLDSAIPFTDKDTQAAALVKEAQQMSLDGDYDGAAKKYSMALKMSARMESLI